MSVALVCVLAFPMDVFTGVCVWVHMEMCEHICGSPRQTSGVHHVPCSPLRQCLSQSLLIH